MLNRRQMLSHVAGGFVFGSVVFNRAVAPPRTAHDLRGWLPQLSKTAQTLVEAEAREGRFAPDLIHRTDFMPRVTLLTYHTHNQDAVVRLQAVQATFRHRGIAMSHPGLTKDGKAWVLFVCAESGDVARSLGNRAGKVVRHQARAA